MMDADSSVSNKDFTEVFKSLKKRIPGKRGKPLEEKVLTIVGFFGSKSNPKESWEKRCDLWNEKNFPEDTGGWYYDDAKQLSKDYQEGLRNLIPSFDFETSKKIKSPWLSVEHASEQRQKDRETQGRPQELFRIPINCEQRLYGKQFGFTTWPKCKTKIE